MALDSKVSFQQRAAQVFVPIEEVTRLEAASIDTFAKFAFCCNYQPRSQNDAPLLTYLETILGSKPEGAAALSYRRLFFESHALCLQGLKSKLERTDGRV